MPATAILLPLAESFGLGALGVTAGGVGAATLGAAGIEAGTLVASTVGGAIIGAGTAAVNAAIQGGDIGKAALGGAVGGGVGAGVGQEVSNVLGTGVGPTGPVLPTGTQAATERGLSALTGGTAGGLAMGQPFETALKSSLPGAAGAGLSGAAQYGLGLSPSVSQAIGQTTTTGLKAAMGPSVSAPTYQAPPTPGLSGQGPAPSATLGQSLSIAPSLGYSPSGTVFGSGGEGDQPKQRVWNVASLRNIGEEA